MAPKRSLTAYMIFSNQIRPELMKQNPEMKVTEVSKHVATRWKVATVIFIPRFCVVSYATGVAQVDYQRK